MLTLRGEHFYFTENIGVTCEIGVLSAPLRVFRPPSPLFWAPKLVPDALAGWISRANGTLGGTGQPASPAIAYDGQLAVNHND